MAITLSGSGIVASNIADGAITSSKISSSIDLSSKTLTLPNSVIGVNNLAIPGAVIKTQMNRSSNAEVTVAATSGTAWFDYTFTTTKANSKILINFHSGQIRKTTQDSNPQIFVRLNNTVNTFHHIDYNHQWYNFNPGAGDGRVFLTGVCLSVDVLAIGTYTINVLCGNYNGSSTFNHQYDSGVDSYQIRRPLFITQEIAG